MTRPLVMACLLTNELLSNWPFILLAESTASNGNLRAKGHLRGLILTDLPCRGIYRSGHKGLRRGGALRVRYAF